jgi:methylmalonyl-CoA mutase
VPLPTESEAHGFETLRDAADGHLASTGVRPRIFLANLGPIADHNARATFARSFFEAGGVEALGNDGFADTLALAEAFSASGASAAVICSSDAHYADAAAGSARALKAAGARLVFLAGRPGEHEAPWREAGVDHFIFVGCDVLATLTALHRELGVQS